MSSGLALTSLIGLFTDRVQYSQMMDLKRAHVLLVGLELVVISVMLVIVASAGGAGAESVAMITSGSLAPAFWIGIIFFGMIVPLCVEGHAVFIRKKPSTTTAAVATDFVGEAGVVVGGFLVRYAIITAAIVMMLL